VTLLLTILAAVASCFS